VGPQVSIEMGSSEGRKPKPVVGQGKQLQPLSHMELSMTCSLFFGEKDEKSMAVLSALDEEHTRWDMIEDCEL